MANIKGDAYVALSAAWPPRFAIQLWWIWKWRNEAIFKGSDVPLGQKLVWLNRKEKEVAAAFAARRHLNMQHNGLAEALVSWIKPQLDWMKMNIDGSSSLVNGLARCGGILRDSSGQWKGGFIYKISDGGGGLGGSSWSANGFTFGSSETGH